MIGGPDRWARLLGWMTVVGLACGIAGPFGSYPANLFTRIAYWVGLFWIGTALLWPSIVMAIHHGARRGFPPLFAGAVAAMIAAIPLAAIAAIGGHLFWPLHSSGMRVLEWYGQTLIVALPAAAIAYLLEVRARRPVSETAIDRPTATSAAASLPSGAAYSGDGPIPDHLLPTILCLQMEDHHVRVHGPARSSLHIAAMRDAIAQLGDGRGMQVHRSWWVANDAVRHVEEAGRGITLILANGLRVPVARNRVALLRECGWLAPAKTALADA